MIGLNILIDLCNDSRFLRILYLFKVILNVICIVVPILLVVVLMFDVAKAIINSDDARLNELKRKGITKIIAAVVVFLVPTFVSLFLSVVNFQGYDDCVKDLTMDRINYLKSKEEEEKRLGYLSNDEQIKKNSEEYANYLKNHSSEGESSGGSTTGDSGVGSKGHINDSNTDCSHEYKNTLLDSEPNPMRVIYCWPETLNASNFVGKDNLGAWPTGSVQNNIGSCGGNKLLFPVSGSYGDQGTQHGGVDIGWTMGTPIYAPADGTAEYYWNKGGNRHGGESTYAVSLYLSTPFKLVVDGRTVKIDHFWLGHMLGVAKRGTYSVKQGDLIGFRGNGCFHNNEVCMAAHLHWSFYGIWEDDNSKALLNNTQVLKIFNLGGLNGATATKNAGECISIPNGSGVVVQVTFKTHGGTLNNKNGDYVVSTTKGSYLPSPGVPKLSGKKFKGWFLSSYGGTKLEFPVEVNGNMVIHAQYENES